MFALGLTTFASRGTTNPAPLVAHELHELAVTHGAVRVLVQLNAPFVAPGAVDRRAIAGIQSLIRHHLSGARHRVIRDYGGRLPVMALEVSPDALQALGSLSDIVTAIHHDRPQRPALAQSVPLIRANSVWAATVDGVNIDGRGQIVVILDSGVEKDHPFFVSGGQTRVIAEACFSSTSSVPPSTSLCPGGVEESIGPGTASPCPTNVNGCYHGTMVAGIAAGNGTGVPGAPAGGVARGASLIAVQIFSQINDPVECAPAGSCARTFTSDQLAALDWIQSQRTAFAGLRIAAVNMSIGGGASSSPCDDDPLKAAIDMLRVPNAGDPTDAGVATVIAAGNAAMADALAMPACISTAIPVVSTTKSNTISDFSNIGSPLVFPNQLLAPGSDINSSWPHGYSWYVGPSLVSPSGPFAVFSGTSAAAPHVAGAIAVLRQASPTASVDDLIERLKTTGPAIVDPQNDPAGNCLVARCPRIDVLAAAPPNLAVQTLTAPKATVPGGTIDVSASLKNKLGRASASTLDIYFSSDSTITTSDLFLGTIAFGPLSAGTTTAPAISPLRTTRVTIPPTTEPGDYFIGAIAGGGETPSETDETDDTKSIPLKVVRPDLTVPSVTVVSSLSATPNGVAPGLNVTVTHRLRNISVVPANAPTSVSGIYLATGQDLASAVALLGTVTAPTVTALTTSGPITATNLTIPVGTLTGAYFVLVQANDDRAVNEMSTSNNVGATALPLLVGPDLTVTKATASPLSVAPGARVVVTNTVRNAGGELTGPFDVGIYLSSDNVYDGGDQLLATRRVAPGLAPGAVSTAVTSVTLPNTLFAGPYFMIVRADVAGEIGEANESNNTLAAALSVVRADLLVQSVTATSSVPATPKAVAPGLPVTLATTIKNQAAAAGPAPPAVLRLYLSTDAVLDGSDVQLGDDIAVRALGGGGGVTLTRIVPIPGGTLPGPYYVLAQVTRPTPCSRPIAPRRVTT